MGASLLWPSLSRQGVGFLLVILSVTDSKHFANAQTPQYDETLHGLPAMFYSGNPNCLDMGHDFGYKMEGCFPGTSVRFDALERTKGTSCANGSIIPDGTFDLECSDADDDQWRTASITLSTLSPVAIMMKGGPGGVIYSGLDGGMTYSLDVGTRKGISHMEFCFSCSDLSTEEEQEQSSPTTRPPTRIPTSRPTTPAPTVLPPPTPVPTLQLSTTDVETLVTPPVQCFHCGTGTPPTKFDDSVEQPDQENTENEIELISGTVPPIRSPAPTVTPQMSLPDGLELISAQVENRSGTASLTISSVWSSWSVVTFLVALQYSG